MLLANLPQGTTHVSALNVTVRTGGMCFASFYCFKYVNQVKSKETNYDTHRTAKCKYDEITLLKERMNFVHIINDVIGGLYAY